MKKHTIHRVRVLANSDGNVAEGVIVGLSKSVGALRDVLSKGKEKASVFGGRDFRMFIGEKGYRS